MDPGPGSKGVIIVGVCAGAKIVANAGLLDGKRATTHWYYLGEMLGEHPTSRYVPDRRIVVDNGIVTTTGITASMTMALILIEAIGSRDKAQAVARELGLADWDARHHSGAFRLTRPFVATVLANSLAFWSWEQLGIELARGTDEVSLALVADAWSRTYRSRALTFAANPGAQQMRNGARIIPDQVATSWPAEQQLPKIGSWPPAGALDQTLQQIAARYGTRTVDVVALQLEYPRTRQ